MYSTLLCVCSEIDHRGRQDVVRTSVTHSDVICDLSIIERTHGNRESVFVIKKYKKNFMQT